MEIDKFYNVQLAESLEKNFKTKNEFSQVLKISRQRLHEILSHKHRLKKDTYNLFLNRISAYQKINSILSAYNLDLMKLKAYILADISETLNKYFETDKRFLNVSRWVDQNGVRIHFIFDAYIESDENINITEIKEINIISEDGDILELDIDFITNFLN